MADELYESLVDASLDPEWEREWSKEIEQRMKDVADKRVELIDADDVQLTTKPIDRVVVSTSKKLSGASSAASSSCHSQRHRSRAGPQRTTAFRKANMRKGDKSASRPDPRTVSHTDPLTAAAILDLPQRGLSPKPPAAYPGGMDRLPHHETQKRQVDENHHEQVHEQVGPTKPNKLSGNGPIPPVQDNTQKAAPTASQRAYDNEKDNEKGNEKGNENEDPPVQVAAHVTTGANGITIRTDASCGLAGAAWIANFGNDQIQTGVADENGVIQFSVQAPVARSAVSMMLKVMTADRKFSFRTDIDSKMLGEGDEQTGETKLGQNQYDLKRDDGEVTPWELSIKGADAFTDTVFDQAGIKVTPRDQLAGEAGLRDDRGHIRIPDARVAKGNGLVSIKRVDDQSGRTIQGGFLSPDGSFDLEFPLEEGASYLVVVEFRAAGLSYMGAVFPAQQGEFNPLLLNKVSGD